MIIKREPWVARAKCRGLDPNLFVLGKGGRPDDALAVCNGTDDNRPCPVRAECLASRHEGNEGGVWGGEFFPSKDSQPSMDEDITDLGSLITEVDDGRPRSV